MTPPRYLKNSLLINILVCLIAIVAPVADTLAESTNTLIISQDEGYAAMASYSEIKAFVSDALKSAGIDMKVVTLPLERANTANSKGEVDGQLARVAAVTEKHPQLNRTSFPLAYINVRIAYLKSNKSFNENSLEKHLGAGLLNNYGISTGALHYTQVSNPIQAMSMLQSKRIDYVLLPETVIQDYLTENPELKKSVIASKRIFVTFPLYFILNKNKAHLLPTIEKALREALKKNRSKYALINESLNPHP